MLVIFPPKQEIWGYFGVFCKLQTLRRRKTLRANVVDESISCATPFPSLENLATYWMARQILSLASTFVRNWEIVASLLPNISFSLAKLFIIIQIMLISGITFEKPAKWGNHFTAYISANIWEIVSSKKALKMSSLVW